MIFDNDGLLLDTESVWTRGEEDLFRRRGREFTLEHKLELVGTSAQIAGRTSLASSARRAPRRTLIVELDALVVEELERGVKPLPGAVELVATLHERGVRTGVVSNSPLSLHHSARSSSAGSTASRRSSAVTTCRPRSRRPDAYLAACDQLGIAPSPEVVASRTRRPGWPRPAPPGSR